jgi:nicotinamide-nucleotide amidase
VIVEIVAVGTELLLGQIVNSNVAFIGERLARDGFDVHHQVTVGDNLDRLAETIRTAIGRSGAVVLTGGIGPTQDDLTREALCLVAGVGMARDRAHAEAIRDRITRLRGSVSENTLRMADYPETATPLPNSNGVALGVAMEIEGVHVYAVPGVPGEMSAMVDEEVLPRLREASGEPAVVRSRVIRTWGLGESRVAEILDDLYASANPTVAFLITDSEVKVRITAKAESVAAADAMIDELDAVVASRLAGVVFGRDDETIESIIVTRLQDLGWRIATVEEVTLGTVGSRIAEAAAGTCVYAGTLTVPSGAAVNEGRAAELLGVVDGFLEADVVLAIGGVDRQVTPDDSTRSVGVAVRTPAGTTTDTVALYGGDDRVRRFAAVGALHALRRALA